MGHEFKMHFTLSFPKLTHNESVSPLLGASTVCNAHSVRAGSIVSTNNSLLIFCFWNFRRRGPAGNGAEWIGPVSCEINLTRCFLPSHYLNVHPTYDWCLTQLQNISPNKKECNFPSLVLCCTNCFLHCGVLWLVLYVLRLILPPFCWFVIHSVGDVVGI